jgi:glycosyltransferase involved in cell wall biosynthesis
MTTEPLVSILIPAYHEKYFPIAFESAQSQTYPNIEIVVTDDSPGTATKNYVAGASSRFPVRYEWNTQRQDRGISNWNFCFRLARGEYIKFLCDDDVLHPDCVERMVRCLQEHNDVTLVTSRRILIDAGGVVLPPRPATLTPVNQDAVIDGRSLCRAFLESSVNMIGEPTSVLFRRADLAPAATNILSFRGHPIRYCADVAMWFTLLTQGNAIYLVDALSYFRRHAQQSGQQGEVSSLFMAEYRDLCNLAEAEGIIDAANRDRLSARSTTRIGYSQLLYRPLFGEANERTWRAAEVDFGMASHLLSTRGSAVVEAHERKTLDDFNEKDYLACNPDLMDAEVKGMVHFLRHGQFEGRPGIPRYCLDGERITKRCFDPWERIVVDVDGNAGPCPRQVGKTGNVFQNGWSAPKAFWDIRMNLLTGRPDSVCFDCAVRDWASVQEVADAAMKRSYLLDYDQTRAAVCATELPDSLTELGNSAAAWEDRKLLLVGHGATRAGGEMVALGIVKHLAIRKAYKIIVLLMSGGELEAEFRQYSKVLVIGDDVKDGEDLGLFLDQVRAEGYLRAICNTAVTGNYTKLLAERGFRVVSLVHELATSIEHYLGRDRPTNISIHADAIVFPARFVAESFVTSFGPASEKVIIRPQGLLAPVVCDDTAAARSRLRERFKLSDDCRVVFGAGSGGFRKGPDLFVQVAKKLISGDSKPICCLWAGKLDIQTQAWVDHDIRACGLAGRVLLTGLHSDLTDFYCGSDVFLLTSREDPFPNVVLDAMSAGLPVVAFLGGGGVPEILTNGTGVAVPYLDIEAMADATNRLLADDGERSRIAKQAQEVIKSGFSYSDYVADLLKLITLKPFSVSVIVPNCNFERFLPQRIESILAQRYPLHEIVFLDDASSDGSVDCAERLLVRSGVPYKIICNETNSGSTFGQWLKGVSAASGDLIWIAEAKDYCGPMLLESLVHAFECKSTVLAYGQSRGVDEAGKTVQEGIELTNIISTTKWLAPYFAKGVEELREAISIKNTIVTASAALFRRRAFLDLGDKDPEFGHKLQSFRTCGDWFVYARLLEHGDLYFCSDTLNYERRRSQAATMATGEALFSEFLHIQSEIDDRHPPDSSAQQKVEEVRQLQFEICGLSNTGSRQYWRHPAFSKYAPGSKSNKRLAQSPQSRGSAERPTADSQPQRLHSLDEAKQYRRTESLIASGKVEEATKALRSLVECGTVMWEVYNDLGTLHFQAGNTAEAIDCLRIASSLEFVSTNALRNLVPAYIATREIGYALGALRMIMISEPEDDNLVAVLRDILLAANHAGLGDVFWLSPELEARYKEISAENNALRQRLSNAEKLISDLEFAQTKTFRLHEMLKR